MGPSSENWEIRWVEGGGEEPAKNYCLRRKNLIFHSCSLGKNIFPYIVIKLQTVYTHTQQYINTNFGNHWCRGR